MQESGIFNIPFGKLAGGVVCAHCGQFLSDHAMTRLVLPFELGGDSSPDNTVYLCETCDTTLGFTVNIHKAFPYISGKQCERIMDYIDSHITAHKPECCCAMCGEEVTGGMSPVVINGNLINLCPSCKEALSESFPYAPEDVKDSIQGCPIEDMFQSYTEPWSPRWGVPAGFSNQPPIGFGDFFGAEEASGDEGDDELPGDGDDGFDWGEDVSIEGEEDTEDDWNPLEDGEIETGDEDVDYDDQDFPGEATEGYNDTETSDLEADFWENAEPVRDETAQRVSELSTMTFEEN